MPSLMPPKMPQFPNDHLLTPREVAEIFGVRTTTLARWTRAGRLSCKLTPGGHRRYQWAHVQKLLEPTEEDVEQERLERDATRLYLQGWSIRRVAAEFDSSYGAMRRILQKHTTLRARDITPETGPGGPGETSGAPRKHPTTTAMAKARTTPAMG